MDTSGESAVIKARPDYQWLHLQQHHSTGINSANGQDKCIVPPTLLEYKYLNGSNCLCLTHALD
jgi:hypothetical protein